MKDGKDVFLTIIILLFAAAIQAQVIEHPNCGMKSPNTLVIDRIETANGTSVFYCSVENQIKDGYFCADKNIHIIYPDGTRTLLNASRGIPVCPDVHNFKSIGEQLDFVLTFPPLKKGTVSIDLTEDCEANCFSFYGIILDNELNKKINNAFVSAEKGEPAQSLMSFSKIADETGDTNPGAEGLLYLNIIKLSVTTGNKVKAAEYYRKLQSSGLPRKSLYLNHLNSQGIRY